MLNFLKNKKYIVVVEDDKSASELMKFWLESLFKEKKDVKVICFSFAQDAFDFVSKKQKKHFISRYRFGIKK